MFRSPSASFTPVKKSKTIKIKNEILFEDSIGFENGYGSDVTANPTPNKDFHNPNSVGYGSDTMSTPFIYRTSQFNSNQN